MKLSLLNRRLHYWLSLTIAVPALLIFVTGIFLQLKKQIAWIQPSEQRGTSKVPSVALSRVLEVCSGVTEAGVRDWNDIKRVDIRPAAGMLKVTTRSSWEIQLDAQTGEILQVAYRRSDWLEALHDGSWFSDWVKFGVFLPTAVILVVLWLTGMYLFWLPIGAKWRRQRAAP